MAERSPNMLRIVLVLAGLASAGLSVSTFAATTGFSMALWVPGLLFSLMVLLPWSHAWALPRWKCAVVVLLGCAGYEAAVFIVYPARFALFALSGAVGSSLAMLLFLFDPRPGLRRAAVVLTIAGTLLACVSYAAFAMNLAGIMLGVGVWQAGLALLMAMLVPVRSRQVTRLP